MAVRFFTAFGSSVFPHDRLWIDFCQIFIFIDKNGRGGEIRTHDLLYPKQARYQATLRPDAGAVKMPAGRKNAMMNFLRACGFTAVI
jgi:hypothetical protein